MVNDNDARREGGGLWNQTGSTMVVNTVTLSENTASGPAEDDGGGAIFNNGGTLNLNGSTLSGNSADGLLGTGGGLHVNAGTANVMLTTISGNSSLTIGGGIYNNAQLMINASTIALNTATVNGGGIYNNSTMITSLKNTIISGNISVGAGADLFSDEAAISSGGYNLIGINNGDFTENDNDITGTLADPVMASLLPLADNGGETFTHALNCPSPAADMGDMADTFSDQAGQAVFNGRRDIGAFEAQQNCALSTNNIIAGVSKSMLYPNPSVNGFVNIRFAENRDANFTVTIYDLATGKLLQTTNATGTDIQMNVEKYAAGTYIVKITSDNAVETQKLIIQN